MRPTLIAQLSSRVSEMTFFATRDLLFASVFLCVLSRSKSRSIPRDLANKHQPRQGGTE